MYESQWISSCGESISGSKRQKYKRRKNERFSMLLIIPNMAIVPSLKLAHSSLFLLRKKSIATSLEPDPGATVIIPQFISQTLLIEFFLN